MPALSKGDRGVKKKLLAGAMALCLFLALAAAPQAAAVSDVCFIAANEELYKLSSRAYFQRSGVYVPYDVFKKFGVYPAYSPYFSTVTLYSASKQLVFDLANGDSYDGSGQYYTVSATIIGGQIYVPVDFVCSQFGLTWSYIEGSGYGDICRIKDAGAILDDAAFLSAASDIMQKRYNAYMESITSTAPPEATPTPTTTTEEPEGPVVCLTFQGLPSDALLDTLKEKSAVCGFFLTADEVRAAPDTVRRIVGEGHAVGVLCGENPADDYAEAAQLIFDAARVHTLLIAAALPELDGVCRSAAEENGLVFWDYDIDGVRGGAGVPYASYITAFLPFYDLRADIRIQCGDASDGSIASVLAYIEESGSSLMPIRETNAPSA